MYEYVLPAGTSCACRPRAGALLFFLVSFRFWPAARCFCPYERHERGVKKGGVLDVSVVPRVAIITSVGDPIDPRQSAG